MGFTNVWERPVIGFGLHISHVQPSRIAGWSITWPVQICGMYKNYRQITNRTGNMKKTLYKLSLLDFHYIDSYF